MLPLSATVLTLCACLLGQRPTALANTESRVLGVFAERLSAGPRT